MKKISALLLSIRVKRGETEPTCKTAQNVPR